MAGFSLEDPAFVKLLAADVTSRYGSAQGWITPEPPADQAVFYQARRIQEGIQVQEQILELMVLSNSDFMQFPQDPGSLALIEEDLDRQIDNILTPRVITGIDNWAELSKYYIALHPEALEHSLTAAPNVEIQVKCCICQQKHLRLPQWLSHETEHAGNTFMFEDLCVLPCGHLFGHECFRAFDVDRLVGRVKAEQMGCPVPGCVARLTHAMCGHRLDIPRLGRVAKETPLQQVLTMVPFTRNYRLLPGTSDVFVDLSVWPKRLATVQNGFSIDANCANCSLLAHRSTHVNANGVYASMHMDKMTPCAATYDCQLARFARKQITGLW